MRIGNYLPGQQPNKRQDAINRALAKRVDGLQYENGNSAVTKHDVYNIINQYFNREVIGSEGSPGSAGADGSAGGISVALLQSDYGMVSNDNGTINGYGGGYSSAGFTTDKENGSINVEKSGFYELTLNALLANNSIWNIGAITIQFVRNIFDMESPIVATAYTPAIAISGAIFFRYRATVQLLAGNQLHWEENIANVGVSEVEFMLKFLAELTAEE